MRIRIAFQEGYDGDMPTMIDGYDEYCEEAWGEVPKFYLDSLSKVEENVREVDVYIPDDVIRNLFGPKRILGRVEPVK